MTDGSRHVYVELQFAPCTELVSTVRRFVESVYQRMLPDDGDAIDRLALATHELVENAVKYSQDGTARLRVDAIGEGSDDHRVSIETANPASSDDVRAMRSLINDMRTAPDLGLFYRKLMGLSARREHGSGLGLGRIRAEAGMELEVAVDGPVVKVRATTKIIGGNSR
jgi:hypothetical protein